MTDTNPPAGRRIDEIHERLEGEFLHHAAADMVFLLAERDRLLAHNGTLMGESQADRALAYEMRAGRDARQVRVEELERQLATAQVDVDGWTLHNRPGGLMLSHDTDADLPTLLGDMHLPLGAVLAFIADVHADTAGGVR